MRAEHLVLVEVQEVALLVAQGALPVSDRGLALVAVTVATQARQPVLVAQAEAVSALLELIPKAGRVVIRAAAVRARLPTRGAALVAQGVLAPPLTRTLLVVTHVTEVVVGAVVVE